MDLDPRLAPKTVNNFVSLARQGYYDDLTFHRVEPGFVIQGGCPEGIRPGRPRLQVRRRAGAGRVPAGHGGHGQRRARHQRLAVLHLPERPAQRPGQAVQPVRPGDQRHGRGAGRPDGRRLPLGHGRGAPSHPDGSASRSTRSTWAAPWAGCARAPGCASRPTGCGGPPAPPRGRPPCASWPAAPGAVDRGAGLGPGRRRPPSSRRPRPARACTTTPRASGPRHPVVAEGWRRHPGLRLGRTALGARGAAARHRGPEGARGRRGPQLARLQPAGGRAGPGAGRSAPAPRSGPPGPAGLPTTCIDSASSASGPRRCWRPAGRRPGSSAWPADRPTS